MAGKSVQFHRSKMAGVPFSGRFGSSLELHSLFDEDPLNPASEAERKSLGYDVYGSLRDYVGRLTIPELRRRLIDHGVEAVPRGPKAALVDLYMENFMPRTLEDFMVRALPFGPECVREIRRLVEVGGTREIQKSSEITDYMMKFKVVRELPDFQRMLESVGDTALSAYPNILLFDRVVLFVETLPREALELYAPLTDGEWLEFERLAGITADAVRYISRATDLRGMIAVDEVVKEWRARAGGDGNELVDLALGDPFLWNDLVSAEIVRGNGIDYLVHTSVLDDDEADFGYDALFDKILDAHEGRDPRLVDQQLMEAEGVGVYLMGTPQAQALIDLLDEHVPDESEDGLFSFLCVAELIKTLRLRDDVVAGVDTMLAYEDVCAVGELATALYHAADDLNRIIPKWLLNGFTIAEDDERAGREPVTLKLAVTDGAEPSGYRSLVEDAAAPKPPSAPAAPVVTSTENKEAKQVSGGSLFGDPYDEDEKDDASDVAKRYEKENEGYLDEFEQWLTKSGLSRKTIKRHVSNMDLYLNDYLAYREELPMSKGTGEAYGFFGGFFIYKCLWSSPSSIRTTAASVKKFYKCMYELGHIEKADLDDLLLDIKLNLDTWCDECAEYDDGVFSGGLW